MMIKVCWKQDQTYYITYWVPTRKMYHFKYTVLNIILNNTIRIYYQPNGYSNNFFLSLFDTALLWIIPINQRVKNISR